jgi:hypothetical protein
MNAGGPERFHGAGRIGRHGVIGAAGILTPGRE